MIFNLLLISIIVVAITDIAMFQESMKRLYWRWLFRREQVKPEYKGLHLPPFDCSLCLTFWVSLGYLIITSQLSLYSLAMTLLIAVLTPVTADAIRLMIDLLTHILDGLRKIANID